MSSGGTDFQSVKKIGQDARATCSNLATAADGLFLRAGRAGHRLRIGHVGRRVGFTDRKIGVNDPVLLGILRAVPEDRRVGRTERNAFARVMGVGFRRQ